MPGWHKSGASLEKKGGAGETDSSGSQVLSQEAMDSTFPCGTQKYTASEFSITRDGECLNPNNPCLNPTSAR